MFLRALRARRQADRRQAAEQALLGQIRDALHQGSFAVAFNVAERLLDAEPSVETYEYLLRPFDGAPTDLDIPHLYGLLERLERDTSTNHEAWRLLLRFALLDRLEWQEQAFALSAAFKRLPERYGWMRYNLGTVLMNRLWAFDEARPEIEAALRAAPNFWKAAGTLAECALCQDRPAESLAIMDDCVARLAAKGLRWDEQTAASGEASCGCGSATMTRRWQISRPAPLRTCRTP